MGQHVECGMLNPEFVANPVDHDIGRKVLKKVL
jgi:hypothetical protein